MSETPEIPQPTPPPKTRRRWRPALAIVGALALVVGTWHQVEPLPPGVHVEGPLRPTPAGHVELLFDQTYRTAAGDSVLDHHIYDRAFTMIDRAHRLVVLDLFLFNDFAGAAGDGFRPLSDQLTERLIERKGAVPSLQVLFVTDPINGHYGGRPSRHVDALRAAGIQVVYTDLERLRDSNPVWSTPWRMAMQWFGNSSALGWLPSPFDPDASVTLRTYLSLLNFKANHRKVVVADDPDGGLVALVTSANPHDGSSRHSNVAAVVRGGAARDVLASELEVARFSGWRGRIEPPPEVTATSHGEVTGDVNDGLPADTLEPDILGADGLATVGDTAAGDVDVRYLTEAAIRDGLISGLARAGDGDRVDVAMFYLSHRGIVNGLAGAARRGAKVRLILDPNRDAFGREKDGIPNRSVAHELVTRGRGNLEVRWYRTEGEQFHTKLTVIRSGGQVTASLGSANLTRRNIGDFNLEANLELTVPTGSSLDRQLGDRFESWWSNTGGVFTDPYERWEDASRWQALKYRVMEATGLSTF